MLDSSNYNSWSKSMITALSAKNKAEFVDGSIQRPAVDDPLHTAWKRCNNMVVSWLVHSVSPSIRQSVLWMDDAKDIWKDLKSRYSQGDKSVSEYFTKLRVMWDEIESYRPDPRCTCKQKCACDALKIVMERKKQDQVMQFLGGLNETFSNVKSNILMMDPMPAISKVFSYAVQQERQIIGSDMYSSSINAATSNKSNVSCTYCEKDYHTVDKCYKKHGYPQESGPARGGRGGGRGSLGRGKLCTHCGNTGHTIDDCYRKHGYPPATTSSNDQKQEKQMREIKLTNQQYEALMAVLQQQGGNLASNASHVNQVGTTSGLSISQAGNSVLTVTCNISKENNNSWILDSGATDHVVSSLHLYSEYRKISPILVKLPNGHQVQATHAGNICFSDNLYLEDVLYLPCFQFNLISISKLMSSLPCQLIFTSNKCLIQDLQHQKMIGTVEVIEGLYKLDVLPLNSPTTHSVSDLQNIVDSVCKRSILTCNKLPIDIWHFRFGHPSSERLQALKQTYPAIDFDKNFVCETCHRAKQKRFSFPNSESHSSSPFNLIHVDIWGPCNIPSMQGHKYFLTVVDDFTRFVWVFLMRSKAETQSTLKNFILHVERQFNVKVKMVRSDNGSEFIMQRFYDETGIIHQTSCIETPQ
uniref:Retrovirus-related Pol polyprotein from transposon TNT 1-94 n=1 Tax=Cajanus cajan TaxID=3821 RepID=A0A151SII2_CAJCA|nr:Retrovirus-related Pol polyprotein from transposon TNT 1-94 [Cajanus cajan]